MLESATDEVYVESFSGVKSPAPLELTESSETLEVIFKYLYPQKVSHEVESFAHDEWDDLQKEVASLDKYGVRFSSATALAVSVALIHTSKIVRGIEHYSTLYARFALRVHNGSFIFERVIEAYAFSDHFENLILMECIAEGIAGDDAFTTAKVIKQLGAEGQFLPLSHRGTHALVKRISFEITACTNTT